MGAGASSLPRVRKALLIRAYNIRAPDQTLLDQFIPHAFRGPDMQMYIFPSQVQKCLDMNKADYAWLEELLRSLFTVPSTNSPAGKVLKLKPLRMHSRKHMLTCLQFLTCLCLPRKLG